MRGLGRRRVSDGPRGGGPRSGTAAAPVGSTRPSDPMRIGRRSFIRRAVPRAMVALSFIRANVLKRRRSLAGRRLVSSSRRPRVVSDRREWDGFRNGVDLAEKRIFCIIKQGKKTREVTSPGPV